MSLNKLKRPNRNLPIKKRFWISQEEQDLLVNQSQDLKLSQGEIVRLSIRKGFVYTKLYLQIIYLVSRIAGHTNQIAHKLNSNKFVDTNKELKEVNEKLSQILKILRGNYDY